MYVRLRPNKSGTTTVYLIDSIRIEGKKHSSNKVVKCFGSSADDKQIQAWVSEAEALKVDLVKNKVTAKKFISIKQEQEIESCYVEELGIKYLYDQLFNNLFSKFELKNINKQLLADLAIMRIAMPVSKLRTARISNNFGIEDMTPNKIYKLMDALDDKKIEALKRHIFNNTKSMLQDNIKIMFYDLTTIYFEANSASELKEFGFSKDGKSQHVQVSLALIVTEHGLPIGYEIFKGNTFEGATLIPTLNKLKEQYAVGDVTIVADSAMLSQKNIDALMAHDYKFIVSARVRNMNKDLTKKMLDQNGYENHNDFRYKTIELDNNQRLIAIFSENRKSKDEYERAKTIDKLKKLEGKGVKFGLKGSINKPYVKINNGGQFCIDEIKLEQNKQLDGYFGFISNADLSAESVISHYKGLWQVEQSFRITKHNLKIRPVYHYVDRRIKAHFAICFLSLALVRSLEYKLKQIGQYIPIEELHEYLLNIKTVKLKLTTQEANIVTDIPEKINNIFLALKIPKPQKYNVICRV